MLRTITELLTRQWQGRQLFAGPVREGGWRGGGPEGGWSAPACGSGGVDGQVLAGQVLVVTQAWTKSSLGQRWGVRRNRKLYVSSAPLRRPFPIPFRASSPHCSLPFLSPPKTGILLKPLFGVFRTKLPSLPLEYFIKYPVHWFGLILKSNRTSHPSKGPIHFINDSTKTWNIFMQSQCDSLRGLGPPFHYGKPQNITTFQTDSGEQYTLWYRGYSLPLIVSLHLYRFFFSWTCFSPDIKLNANQIHIWLSVADLTFKENFRKMISLG